MAEEAARIALRHGIKNLPPIVEASFGRAKTHAQILSFKDGSYRIEVNKNLKNFDWQWRAKQAAIKGWYASNNSVLHEIGHYVDFTLHNNVPYEKPKKFGKKSSFIKKNVSLAAAVDDREFEAEIVSGIMQGKTYSDEILSLSRVLKSDNELSKRLLSYASGDSVCLPSEEVSKGFKDAMKAVFNQKGSSFSIDIMADENVQSLIEAHTSVLDRNLQRLEMSDLMRQRLTRSNYIFSGLKTFHELNEAFPSLLDENGNKKTFERFLNDVRKIDETYNSNYLRAEYNFVQASAEMAAKWEKFAEDGDHYYLQYRTQHDDKVRPEHASLDRVTLPPSDSFWESYYPPNGWNCRCTVVQVLKRKYEPTPHDEAMALGEDALQTDKKGIFRFNSGKEQKTVPDYNPYTIKRCRDCDIAKGKLNLAFVPENELCAACKLLQKCAGDKQKSERAIERTHYLHEMEPLLKKSEMLKTDNKDIKVGFTKEGNKHLFSDTFGRSSVLVKDDLASLDQALHNANFIDSAALTHPRKDNIDRFFYYEAEIRGHKVKLNVARKVKKRDNGKIQEYHFLYSINDI